MTCFIITNVTLVNRSKCWQHFERMFKIEILGSVELHVPCKQSQDFSRKIEGDSARRE